MVQVAQYFVATLLHGNGVAKSNQRRPQSPGDLDRGRAELSYFVERQRQIILPCRYREGHANGTGRVASITGIQLPASKPPQQILDLIERLNRCRWVIDGG